jgi:hypothetical protein
MKKWLQLTPNPADGGGSGTATADAGGAGQAGQAGVGASTGTQTGDGGAGAGDTDDGAALFNDDSGQQGQQTGDGQTGDSGQPAAGATGAAVAAGTTALTKDDIAQILAQAGIGQQQVQPSTGQAGQQNQPQISEADFNKQFNVYFPSTDVLSGLRSDDPKVQTAAFLAMRDGIIKQALTMSEYRAQQAREQLLNEHIQPISQYVESERNERNRESFFKANEDLRPYQQIVDAVATSLQQKGFQAKTLKEYHTRYAAEARAMLKQAGINLTGSTANANANGQGAGAAAGKIGNGNNGNGTQPNQRKMSALTGGGQSSGGRQAGGPSGPAGMEVFD